MRDVEKDGRGRGDDGLTTSQRLGMTRARLRDKPENDDLWNTRQKGSSGKSIRQTTLDGIQEMAEDDNLHPLVRVKVFDTVLKMEQQNLVARRMNMEVVGSGESEATVILVLPQNGSEVRQGVSAAEDEGEFEGDGDE